MNSPTQPSDLDRVMGRIEKLLAIAQDTRANPHEAAAAAGQVERLMAKYQLDNAALAAVGWVARLPAGAHQEAGHRG